VALLMDCWAESIIIQAYIRNGFGDVELQRTVS
jgi:hypothetical protein